MMKQIITFLLCGIVTAGCNKTKDDISGTSTIAGRIYIENTFDGQPARLLATQDIQVFNDTSINAGNFFLGGKSDKDGNFTFNYLYESRYYRLRAEKREAIRLDNNILFTANQLLQPAGDIKLVLRPDTSQQNAILVSCIDTLLLIPGKIPGDSIFLYTSRLLANLDSAAVSGAGASYKFTASSDGTAFKMNLPTDSLFINAAITIGGRRLKHKVTAVKLEKSGVKSAAIVMRL